MRFQYRKYPTHLRTKRLQRESSCFLTKNFRIRQISTIWNLVFAFPLRIILKLRKLSFKKDNRSGSFITVRISRRIQRVDIYLANERSFLAFFSSKLGHIFGSNVGNGFGVMLRGKLPEKPEFAYDILSYDIHGPD